VRMNDFMRAVEKVLNRDRNLDVREKGVMFV
jgi:hypothetical protein